MLKSFKISATILILGSIIVLWAVNPGKAAEWQIGAHGGFSLTKDDAPAYHQYEAYLNYGLPWGWGRPEGIQMGTLLTSALGILDSGPDSGVAGTLGLQLRFSAPAKKFDLFLGSGATLMSESEYNGQDLGGSFQFTSHIGIAYRLFSTLSVTVQYRHISNADIYDANPGLDMILMGLRYAF